MFVPCVCCVVSLRPTDHFFRGVLAAVFVCDVDTNNEAVWA
jgi:hypothetical protein